MKSTFLKLAALSALTVAGQASTLFMGAYPNAILVFDETQGKVVDRIPLATGLPTSMRLSADKKKIYVTTNDHAGIEVIDVATHKILNHFVLDSPTKRFRFNGGTPDPSGKLLYTTTTEINKLVDHFEIGKPKYTVIDLEQQKITKTVDIPTADATGMGRGGFEISPDGKFLYQFRNNIIILNSDDFKEVSRIDLAKPDLPSMENVGFGGQLDSFRDPTQHISVFNSADPIVHNRVFGIGRFDLTTRQMEFTPIGPSPASMSGLQVTSDKKDAYAVISTGMHGNKRCEFWHFDLGSNKLANTVEFACRSRFSFGMSGDGKKLYIYGANFEIEVYDAATMKYEKTWDLNNDITMAGLIIVD